MGPFSSDKWFVCHGIGSTVHFVELTAGSKLTTGQSNVEEFDDETSALTRAKALGYEEENIITPEELGELP